MSIRCLIVAAVIAGCASTEGGRDLVPSIDVSPVGCGYKWFQSGYSPAIRIPCDQERSALKEANVNLARAHAWEIAERRCPDSCAPIELQDTVEAKDRMPDGVCRDGYAYFSTRLFFQCGAK